MDTRTDKLLLDVADQFKNASTPIYPEWLQENNVALDELGDLCDQLSTIIRGFIKAPRRVQQQICVCSAAESKEQAEMLVSTLERAQLIQRLKGK